MIWFIFTIGWIVVSVIAYFFGESNGIKLNVQSVYRKAYALGLQHGLERAEMLTKTGVVAAHDTYIAWVRKKNPALK